MTMSYTWKVRLLKRPRGSLFWRYWRAWRGDDVGNYNRLPDYIRRYAPGYSFADIGCMWGVNGEYSFIAEEAGATAVKAVDLFGPTPEFEAKRQARNSAVEFILGDCSRPETIARIGVVDVVFCAGVLLPRRLVPSSSPRQFPVLFPRVLCRVLSAAISSHSKSADRAGRAI